MQHDIILEFSRNFEWKILSDILPHIDKEFLMLFLSTADNSINISSILFKHETSNLWFRFEFEFLAVAW